MAPYRVQPEARPAFEGRRLLPRARRGPELETGPLAIPSGSRRRSRRIAPLSGVRPSARAVSAPAQAPGAASRGHSAGAGYPRDWKAAGFPLQFWFSFIRRVQGSNLFRRAVLKPWTRTSEHAVRMRRAPDGQRTRTTDDMAREDYCRKHPRWRAQRFPRSVSGMVGRIGEDGGSVRCPFGNDRLELVIRSSPARNPM